MGCYCFLSTVLPVSMYGCGGWIGLSVCGSHGLSRLMIPFSLLPFHTGRVATHETRVDIFSCLVDDGDDDDDGVVVRSVAIIY